MSEFSFNITLNFLDNDIPDATPDEALYPRYKTGTLQGSFSMPGFTVVRNASGTDYQFISFADALSDEDVSDEYKNAYQRIISSDTKDFLLADEADKMKSLFRVSTSAFQMGHDRECEIDEGYIHKDYMLVALRSFAWTLAAYCDKNNKTPESVTIDELNDIIKHCENKDWLNFEADSFCKGLCDNGELHIYYIPDASANSDRQLLEPSQEDYDRVESMRRSFPAYNEILDQVRSLDSLRLDLEYVYPAMTTFCNLLNADRNRDEELTGSMADILYAWCAITKAAKEPFYIEDGPMRCFFTQLTGRIPQIEQQPIPAVQRQQSTSPVKSQSVSASIKSEDDKLTVVQLEENSDGVRFSDGEFQGYFGNHKHIALPKETETIGMDSLSGTTVETVVIPEGVTEIEMGAFDFAHIIHIVLPSTLDKIGINAFRYCSALEEVILPDGLTEIEQDAFSGCDNLKYIFIPSSVYDFGIDCFDSLEDCIFHVEPGSDAEDYLRDNYEDYTIVYHKPLGFGNRLEFSVVPDYEAKKANAVNEDGFLTITAKTDGVSISSDGLLITYEGTAPNIIIADDVSVIGQASFQCNETIENVIIKDSVKVIEQMAFWQSPNLRSAILPNGITEIALSLFEDCESLEEITIPDSVERIESSAFSNCTSLYSVVFSKNLKTIGLCAFSGCSSLTSIDLPDGLEVIDNQAFSECESLESVTIPSSVIKIHEWAFDFEQDIQFFVAEGSYADKFLREQSLKMAQETDGEDLINIIYI